MKELLDDVHGYLGTHIAYPNPHSHVAHTLWILGSGFLEYDDIPVFDNYPILAFLSPDEDSGKTRALDVTEVLAHNAINGGSYTAASLCAEIDKRYPKLLTMILDELDETFVSGRNNSDYIRLLNNGYQRGKVIVRRSLTADGNVTTNSYCPKAIAGLTATKLKRTTRSRMITVRMRPMRKGENIARHIDRAEGAELRQKIEVWRPTVIDDLKRIDEDSLSDLTKRAAQIWHPLLAIAQLAGDDWFKRSIDAARFFVDKQKPDEILRKQILMKLYRVYASNKHPKGYGAKPLQTSYTYGDIQKTSANTRSLTPLAKVPKAKTTRSGRAILPR